MQRRSFLKNAVVLGSSAYFGSRAMAWPDSSLPVSATGKKIGIIGLDTSHSEAFTRVLNTAAENIYNNYCVTAAYPYGSKTIASSYNRIPGYIEKVKSHNVAICNSIDELLKQVDCVLPETNDGRLHPEQAAVVFQTHKPVFIDKPIGANLKEVAQVYEAAAKHGSSFFSSSSLRYEKRNIVLSDYEGYDGLLKAIIQYFETGEVPVPPTGNERDICVYERISKKQTVAWKKSAVATFLINIHLQLINFR